MIYSLFTDEKIGVLNHCRSSHSQQGCCWDLRPRLANWAALGEGGGAADGLFHGEGSWGVCEPSRDWTSPRKGESTTGRPHPAVRLRVNRKVKVKLWLPLFRRSLLPGPNSLHRALCPVGIWFYFKVELKWERCH